MKLLIVTQTVDKNDLYLGFFHTWIAELAGRFERIEVIGLKVGEHTLPQNVCVHSLGKEQGRTSWLVYAWRFLRLAWRLHREYDCVLVHMNQEYLLITGWLWFALGKRMYLWRNHYAGSRLTDIAAAFCTKVFCTSRYSYTAKYKKTMLMPVGVDTNLYKEAPVPRKPRSVLFYARLSPSKRPDLLIEALALLKNDSVPFMVSIYGTPLPQDEAYLEQLKVRASRIGNIEFRPGRPPADGPSIFSAHEIFVNLGASGMYDKMLFEAAACGCLVLAASADWAELVGEQFTFKPNDAKDLAWKLKMLLNLADSQKQGFTVILRNVAEAHNLKELGKRLVAQIQK